VNAHFKPFAAIGYEYNKVRANTGNATFGNSVQFSIPQFGDFFHDMVAHVVLDTVSASAGVCPAYPADIGTTPFAAGDSYSFVAATSYTRYTYKYETLNGVAVATPGTTPATNFVRYCEFPGQRLFKKVKFEVNGNPLDEYTAEAYMYYQKFRVAPGKQTGWARLVGQEIPLSAVGDLASVAGVSAFPAAATGLTQFVGGAAAPAAPTNASNTARKMFQVLDGPQTAKATQPELDLWVPLLFWFNVDSRLSIASVSIPYGQRFITIDLEAQNNLVYTAPGNLFLKLTTQVFVGPDSPASAVTPTQYSKTETRTPVLATGSTVSSSQSIKTMELYINNIFVNPEIKC
jgi:hypothetical protein